MNLWNVAVRIAGSSAIGVGRPMLAAHKGAKVRAATPARGCENGAVTGRSRHSRLRMRDATMTGNAWLGP